MNHPLNFIFVGSSKLLYSCADIIKTYYGDKAHIAILDTAYSPMNRSYKTKFPELFDCSTKDEVFEILDGNNRGIILSINNPYIIPKRFYENSEYTIINLHHALLPHHPGRNAEACAIFDQDK